MFDIQLMALPQYLIYLGGKQVLLGLLLFFRFGSRSGDLFY